jgi:hypothetical protein
VGWSCTTAASRTLGKLTRACVVATGSQNVFRANGERFFWENDREDYDDGRVKGVVYKMVGEGCVAYAHFEIEPSGLLAYGHKWMHDALTGG